MEIITQTLTTEQIRNELGYIVDFFRAHGTEELTVRYGWSCNLPMDELWQDIATTAEGLPRLVERSIADGLYPIGDADLFIRDRPGRVEFLLCHESDVHCESTDMEIVEQVKQQWQKRGYGGYEKSDNKAASVSFSPHAS